MNSGAMNRRAMLAGATTAAMALAACSQEPKPAAEGPPKVINFSVLTTENAAGLQQIWDPILADMQKAVGIPIKAFFATNYTALIEAMRFKQTDVGWFSNLSGLEAVRRAGGEVFAHTTDPSGVEGYFSVIIAPASSKLTVEDLLKCDRTLDFGMGDAKSTSGTLAPKTYLFSPRGVDPAKCFKTVRTANHQANLFAVANGVIDAATNNSSGLSVEKGRNPALVSKVKVIWQSPALPEDPMVWRKDLDPATKEKIRAFFLAYGAGQDAEGQRQRDLLKKLTIAGFKPADDTHLLPVREMEATEQLEEAKMAGDPAKVSAAQATLNGIRAERAAIANKAVEPGQPAPPG